MGRRLAIASQSLCDAGGLSPRLVVVGAVLAVDLLEVPLVEDQHPGQAFPAATPNPALGISICPGRHQRSQDHPNALRLEDTVGLRREFLVPIVNHDAELHPFVVELPAKVASLLGDPGGMAQVTARSTAHRSARRIY